MNEEEVKKALEEAVSSAVIKAKEEGENEVKAVKESLEKAEANIKKLAEAQAKAISEGHNPAPAQKCLKAFMMGVKSKNLSMQKAAFSEFAKAKGMNETTDSEGGFLVPTEFASDILRTIPKYGVARQIFRNLPMATDSKNVNALSGEAAFTMVAEGGVGVDSTLTFTQKQLVVKKAIGYVIGSSELVDDNMSEIQIWDLVRERFAVGLAKIEDEQCFVGDGAGNNILGLFSHTDTDLSEKVQTGNSYADIDVDNLLDLTELVPEEIHGECSFLMSLSIVNIIRTKKDSTGQYLFEKPTETQIAKGMVGSIWGFPIYTSSVLPKKTDASQLDKRFVAFGDFNLGGVIGNRRELRLKQLTEGTIKLGATDVNLSTTDQEALRCTARFGFQVVYGKAIAFLKTAAA